MEKLIVIAVIILGSIVHSWIQRKQEEAEEKKSAQDPRPRNTPGPRPERRPATPPPVPAAPPRQWQDDLRRLLQGETPGDRRSPEGPADSGSRPGRRTPAAPPPLLARSSIPVPDEGMEMEVGLPVAPVTLSQASSAHERAQVASAVLERMRATGNQITTHSAAPPVGHTQQQAPADARRLFKNRQAQRDAILASIILGPPKALENLSQ